MALALIAPVAACAAADQPRNIADTNGATAQKKAETAMSNEALPVNQRFPNLDAYLLYLQNYSGPSDGPWYKFVRPGVYELQTGNKRQIVGEEDAPEQRIFTREELLRKFGFSE